MKGVKLAEWLLRRTTTPEHAAAQLGDLLELSQSRSLSQTRATLWFWRNVLASFFHASARPTLAFLAAFALSQLVEQLWNHGLFGNRADLNSVWTTGALLLVPLTVIPIFSLVRYGIRDACARRSFAFALLSAIAIAAILAYNPHPNDLWIMPALIILTFFLLRLSRRRIALRPLAQLTSALAISQIGILAIITCIFFLSAIFSMWFGIGDLAFRINRSIGRHPLTDLIDAAICLLMIRASNHIRHSRTADPIP